MSRLIFEPSTSPASGLTRGDPEPPPVDRDTDPGCVVGDTPPQAVSPPPDAVKRGWRGWLRFFKKGPAVDSVQANLTHLEESMLNLP